VRRTAFAPQTNVREPTDGHSWLGALVSILKDGNASTIDVVKRHFRGLLPRVDKTLNLRKLKILPFSADQSFLFRAR